MTVNDRFTFLSFHANQPSHSIRLFQTLTKGKVPKPAQYPTDLLPLHFTSLRPTFLKIQIEFMVSQNLTLKNPRSRSCGRLKLRSHSWPSIHPNALPFHYTPIGPTIPKIRQIECLTVNNISEILKKKKMIQIVSNRIPPELNYAISITREL